MQEKRLPDAFCHNVKLLRPQQIEGLTVVNWITGQTGLCVPQPTILFYLARNKFWADFSPRWVIADPQRFIQTFQHERIPAPEEKHCAVDDVVLLKGKELIKSRYLARQADNVCVDPPTSPIGKQLVSEKV